MENSSFKKDDGSYQNGWFDYVVPEFFVWIDNRYQLLFMYKLDAQWNITGATAQYECVVAFVSGQNQPIIPEIYRG